jgi:hypothetical protein
LIAPLSIAPTSIFTLGSATGQIVLTSPAPSKTPIVTLSSSNTQVATVSPTSITIPVGGISAPFTVLGHSPGTATITASLGTAIASGTITVTTRPTGKEKREKEVLVDKGSFLAEKAALPEQIHPGKIVELHPQFSQPGSAPTDPPASPGNLQETREQVPPTGRAFIRPEERPALGQEVLSDQESENRSQDSGGR